MTWAGADAGCYGGRVIPTPNLDRLAREGMRFTQAYSGCVVCAPARSVLMTGMHMGHTSVRLNTGGVPLRDEDVTVGEVLGAAGYTVGGFGKWGLGDIGTTGVPEKQGFDVFYGYYHQIHAHSYCPEFLVRNGSKEMLPGNAGFYKANKRLGPFPRAGGAGGRRQYVPDLVLAETLRFLRDNKDGPFFCYAPWTPPHGEFIVPDDDPAWRQFADRDWPMKARVAAAYIAMIDRHVGAVLAELATLGIADDTVVLFCSDHGADSRFEGTLDSCGPFRGRKRAVYEGGIRVPLIARWPHHIPAGAVSDHLCGFHDVLPTLAELGGAAAPAGIDGISFVPTLLAKGEQQQHDALYWEWQRYDWGKRRLRPDGLMQAVRRGQWKAVRTATGRPVELYDLVADPGEQRNLAAAQPERTAELEKLMAAMRTPMRPQREPEMPAGRKFR